MKRCTKCFTLKPFSDFPARKRNKDGRNSSCKACCAAYDAKRYATDKDKILNWNKQYREREREHRIEYLKQYRIDNREELRLKMIADRAKTNKRSRLWYRENKAHCFEKAAARRFAKQRATPLWADREAMRKIYEQAQAMRDQGQQVEVDHIHPLQNDLICGLHVADNLRITTRQVNRAKHNNFTPYIESEI